MGADLFLWASSTTAMLLELALSFIRLGALLASERDFRISVDVTDVLEKIAPLPEATSTHVAHKRALLVVHCTLVHTQMIALPERLPALVTNKFASTSSSFSLKISDFITRFPPHRNGSFPMIC
mmetsp:Transcript_9888/g.20784  ORF Transcript_9888/g.20784 Transcript_9888/m.20784 type:complete len:124 (-) Transcript_9888:281-652(-)